MLVLYICALFLGSALLFLLEPMFAKMILPSFGGAPAVWNTCVVFYQGTLLAGYLYAHYISARLSLRLQVIVHVLLLAVAATFLPVRMVALFASGPAAAPTVQLFLLLLVSVGGPFLVVSANAPLLQRWFAASRHPLARDPFFLYAVSNLGSMLALAIYPTLVEPWLPLRQQSLGWTGAYGLLVVLTAACAMFVWNAGRQPALAPGMEAAPVRAVGPRLRATWVLLSLVPSSLMLSVTTYATTDIAPVPILWVVPLALYLLSFVVVFARRPLVSVRSASLALVVLGCPLLVAMAVRQIAPPWLLIPLHLVTFFVAAILCHGRLAASRPPAVYVTDFYLWISIGGVLGGLFNTLVAPLIFRTTLEYPLGLVAAFMLRPDGALTWESIREGWRRRWATAAPAVLVVIMVAGLLLAKRSEAEWETLVAAGVLFGPLAAFGAATWRRRAYPSIAAAALVFTGLLMQAQDGSRLHTERNFFGVKTVSNSSDGAFRQFLHGNTLHGMQALAPDRRTEPTGYYDRTGPLGDVFGSLGLGRPGLRIAVLGLGVGGMSCYAAPGQEWTFYEIDPAVERIAREARFFTFLKDCAPHAKVVLGDARLSIAGAPDGAYDVIALDVFSSDAIPMHLLTIEAMQVYLRKLREPGLLLFHISNRYLDLAPVVGVLARDAGLTGAIRRDQDRRDGKWPAGKQGSTWAIAAPAGNAAVLSQLTSGLASRWRLLSCRPGARPWTDDYSNLLSALKW